MEDAPGTIGEKITQYSQESYIFAPKNKQITTLKVASDINLPGVVTYDPENIDLDYFNPS